MRQVLIFHSNFQPKTELLPYFDPPRVKNWCAKFFQSMIIPNILSVWLSVKYSPFNFIQFYTFSSKTIEFLIRGILAPSAPIATVF